MQSSNLGTFWRDQRQIWLYSCLQSKAGGSRSWPHRIVWHNSTEDFWTSWDCIPESLSKNENQHDAWYEPRALPSLSPVDMWPCRTQWLPWQDWNAGWQHLKHENFQVKVVFLEGKVPVLPTPSPGYSFHPFHGSSPTSCRDTLSPLAPWFQSVTFSSKAVHASNHGWLQHATHGTAHRNTNIQFSKVTPPLLEVPRTSAIETDTNCSILHKKWCRKPMNEGFCLSALLSSGYLYHFLSVWQYMYHWLMDRLPRYRIRLQFTTAERTSQRSSQKVIKEPEKEARCKRLTAHCCSQPCCLSHHHSHAQAKWCVQPALQGQVQETGAGADHQYKSSVGFLTTHPP